MFAVRTTTFTTWLGMGERWGVERCGKGIRGDICMQDRGGDEGDGEGRGEVGRSEGLMAWMWEVGNGGEGRMRCGE